MSGEARKCVQHTEPFLIKICIVLWLGENPFEREKYDFTKPFSFSFVVVTAIGGTRHVLHSIDVVGKRSYSLRFTRKNESMLPVKENEPVNLLFADGECFFFFF